MTLRVPAPTVTAPDFASRSKTGRKKRVDTGTPRTHGLTTVTAPPETVSLYNRWAGMRGRCRNPRDGSYHNYGGRGITVCPEWEDFPTFHEWATANGYHPSLSLDRIDNDGNYEPSNCRWTDRKTQARNRRHRRMLTHRGRTQPVSVWAEEIGITTNSLLGRLRIGWSVERALTTPGLPPCGVAEDNPEFHRKETPAMAAKRRRREELRVVAKSMTTVELAEHFGVSLSVILPDLRAVGVKAKRRPPATKYAWETVTPEMWRDWSAREIAAFLGLHRPSAVSDYRKRHDIPKGVDGRSKRWQR